MNVVCGLYFIVFWNFNILMKKVFVVFMLVMCKWICFMMVLLGILVKGVFGVLLIKFW